jgi:hypothetical protein
VRDKREKLRESEVEEGRGREIDREGEREREGTFSYLGRYRNREQHLVRHKDLGTRFRHTHKSK